MDISSKPRRALRLKPLYEARSLIVGVGLIITLLAVIFQFRPPQLLDVLNYRVYDLMLSVKDPGEPSDIPVLIGIDDKSLEAFGQWPWPRYRLAQLVDQLGQAGVDVVALDMLMPERDRTSPEVILRERRRDLGETDISVEMLDGQQVGNDEIFADALERTPTVLSYKFLYGSEANVSSTFAPEKLSNIISRQEPGSLQYWPKPDAALGSLDQFNAVAAAIGFTNVSADNDGILRRVPLLIQDRSGGYHSGLAFAALRQQGSADSLRINVSHQEAIVHWRGHRIPLDEQGRMLLNYYDSKAAFSYHSAADVLSGRLTEDALAGKIAFVGAWASGLGDRHATPYDKSAPGLSVHAVIASNLLTGSFLQQPAWSRGAELFFVLGLGIVSTWLISRFGFLVNLLLLMFGSFVPVIGAFTIFNASGIYIPFVMPLILLFVNCGVLGVVRYGIEARKVYNRTRDLVAAQNATIMGMVSLSEARDEETGEHILRTQHYVRTLAEQIKTLDSYKASLLEEDIELLFKSAPLHDIGKVGIPDRVLHKEGRLTEEEFAIMKTHPVIGEKALVSTVVTSLHQESSGYLAYARDVVISHHEKWDGSGYPYGLKGNEIPLAGRLMALADVYDALISKRVYKSAMSHEQAKEIILEGKGSHFDPDVVEAFLVREQAFIEICERFREESPEDAIP